MPDRFDLRIVATRLRRGRELVGLTLSQATRLLGWHGSSLLSELEDGTSVPTDANLTRLAALYQTTVSWLLGDEPQISDEGHAMLRSIEDTSDREAIREVMELWSTPERPGFPARPRPRSLAEVASERSASEPDPAAVPVDRKRRYVASQSQTRDHHCHWPGCDKQVPPAMWGCKSHWMRLPKTLRDRIWRTYAPGQEVDMSPSDEYLQVADDVQQWIREHGGTP